MPRTGFLIRYRSSTVEGHLLQTIGWTIGHPTAEAWMRLYCQGTQESTQVQHVARFIMETTLFTRDFVGLKPSNIARGCLLMARHICGLGPRVDLCPAEKEVKHVTTCLDISFSENAKHVSNICIEKVSMVVPISAEKPRLIPFLYAVRSSLLQQGLDRHHAILCHGSTIPTG